MIYSWDIVLIYLWFAYCTSNAFVSDKMINNMDDVMNLLGNWTMFISNC